MKTRCFGLFSDFSYGCWCSSLRPNKEGVFDIRLFWLKKFNAFFTLLHYKAVGEFTPEKGTCWFRSGGQDGQAITPSDVNLKFWFNIYMQSNNITRLDHSHWLFTSFSTTSLFPSLLLLYSNFWFLLMETFWFLQFAMNTLVCSFHFKNGFWII